MTVRDFISNFDFNDFGTQDIFFIINSNCSNLIANKSNRSEDFNSNQIKFIISIYGDYKIKSWKVIPDIRANGNYSGLTIRVEVEN